jgi:hypothetical protein
MISWQIGSVHLEIPFDRIELVCTVSNCEYIEGEGSTFRAAFAEASRVSGKEEK